MSDKKIILSQTKPSAYPETNKIPENDDNKKRLLDPHDPGIDTPNEITDPGLTGFPGNLVKEPRINDPEQQLKRFNEQEADGTQILPKLSNPSGPNNGTQPGTKPFTSPMPGEIRPRYNLEDVDQINPYLAMKMKTAGITYIDKEMFDNHYNKKVKQAILKKLPLSEILN